ncbi:MAG: polymorphic toxin-type HINT domain-containing protein [bacterium]
MEYKTLPIKYRPRKLTDLCGQEHIITSIKNFFKRQQIPNVFLFTGQYGSGKTTTARLVTSMLNCEKGVTIEPCGECAFCNKTKNGSSIDIQEIDAATYRGIDKIRALKEFARYGTSEMRYKIIILDECLGKNSKIDTEHGLMGIEDIVLHKKEVNVKSYNEQTDKIEYKPITNWFVNSGKQINKLSFESSGIIYASDGHLINTPDRGYVKVSELSIGDFVFRIGTNEDTSIITERILEKKKTSFENKTYDIEVADNHNYFVSGTLVHNCHQLTGEANNSLLKLLEEPPSNMYIFLCTTEPRQVLPTIHSRCQRFDFKKLLPAQIYSHIKNICEQEEMNFEDETLRIISKISNGSMRDALRNVEALRNYCDENLDVKSCYKLFGVPDSMFAFDMVDKIIKRKTTEGMLLINQSEEVGTDINLMIKDISQHMRDLLVLKTCKTNSLVHAFGGTLEKLKDQSNRINVVGLIKIMKVFEDAMSTTVYNLQPKHVLEKAFIESIIIYYQEETSQKKSSSK